MKLRTIKKPLFKNELVEKYTLENNIIALTDKELDATNILPNSRLSQDRFENSWKEFSENGFPIGASLFDWDNKSEETQLFNTFLTV